MVHADLQDVMNGNCLPLETVPILTASCSFVSNLLSDPPSVVTLNDSIPRSRVFEPDEQAVQDHDYTFIPTMSLLSACVEKIVAYIVGFVVFKLKSVLRCETCIGALTENDEKEVCSLIKLKTKGGLIFPSKDVMAVCIYCEKCFRRNVAVCGSAPSSVSVAEITQLILHAYARKDWFASLHEHMFECDVHGRHNDFESGGYKFASGASEKNFLHPPPLLAYLGGHKT